MQCSGCNSTSIDIEAGDQICLDCGLTFSKNDRLQPSITGDGLTYINKRLFDGLRVPCSVKNSVLHKETARACKNALDRTVRIAEYFKLNGVKIQEVKDIFQSLVRSSKFIKKYYKSKIILGGVVISIVSNRSGFPIPKERICERVGCCLPDFKWALNLALEANPSLKPDPKPICDSIPFLVNEAKFDDLDVKVIQDRCKMLVQMISESNMMEGKNPIHVIHAALCLTWKSIKPRERGLNKITFKKFCSLCNITYSETGNQRFKELIEFITNLVTYLPWNKLSIDVIKGNIAFHLVDILNHSNLVLHRYNEANRPMVPIEIQETSNLMANYQPIVLPVEEPEISEKEIEGYLRSDKEIKLIKKLRQGIESTPKRWC